jgi:hypothetical protein
MTDVTVGDGRMQHDGQGKEGQRAGLRGRRPGSIFSGVTVLIIGGVRVFFHTTGEGVFHCQRCCADRQYRGRSGRRFVTVFFVPLVPLGKVGEHVQCRTCGTRYHAGVLGLAATA